MKHLTFKRILHYINKNSNDELLVAISGVVFQSLYYLLFMFLAKYNFFNDYTISLFKSYHFHCCQKY